LFSRLNVGGPAIHVILLTAELDRRGYETRLVIGQEDDREGNLHHLATAKGVRSEQIAALGREIRPFSDLRALYTIWRLLRDFRPSIVHTHTAKAGLLGRLAAWMAGVPVVVHTFHGHVLRGYFGPTLTAFFRWIERRMARLSHVLIAVSAAVKNDLVEFGVARADQVRVIPLGLELARFARPLPCGRLRGEAGIPSDAPLIGIVGRLVPIKDVTSFLRAAALVRKSLPYCHFSVVGDGPERLLLESQAGQLGLDSVVHFHGWHSEMEGVYGDLDVVVNSSLNEGTPVALIEALAAGRPVVATDVGGNGDLLGAGARGTLVPASDPRALARAVIDALDVGAKAAQQRARLGQTYVLREHASERLVDDIDALYRELLGEGTQQAPKQA
jgi:glycosyltransferase involved in cell wall biosynthesis